MTFDRIRAVTRPLLLAVTGAIAALAATRGLYATALLAVLTAIWIAALGLIDTVPPVIPLPPPPPVLPDEEERRRLTAYLDLSPAPLVALDGGRLRVVNRAARRLLAATDLVPDPPPALLAALADTRPGRTATIDMHDDREVRSFALATGDLALSGRMMRIGALIDIHAELKAAEATALRELVQVLSHEIVNALTPIASLADTAVAMLDDPVPALPQVREAIETVARRAASLHRFGESYRALARLPVPTLMRLSTIDFVADLQRLFVIRWPGIALTIDLDRAPPHAQADSDQFTAAVWALLQNAAEALGTTTAAPRITLSVEALVEHVQIAIEDNGPGIPEGDREDVFRPFFTTKPAGTGVGLALARQIVRGHGGDIMLASAVPGLTRFDILLPTR